MSDYGLWPNPTYDVQLSGRSEFIRDGVVTSTHNIAAEAAPTMIVTLINIAWSAEAVFLQLAVKRALAYTQRLGHFPAIAVMPVQQLRDVPCLDFLQRGLRRG